MKNILVIEQNNKLLNLYKKWLQGEFNVTTLDSVTDSTNYDDFDLIIISFNKDNELILDFIDNITSKNNKTKIILLTKVSPSIQHLQRSIHAFIKKPIRKREFLEIIYSVEVLSDKSDIISKWLMLYNRQQICTRLMTQDRQKNSNFLKSINNHLEEIENQSDMTKEELIMEYNEHRLTNL